MEEKSSTLRSLPPLATTPPSLVFLFQKAQKRVSNLEKRFLILWILQKCTNGVRASFQNVSKMRKRLPLRVSMLNRSLLLAEI